MIISYFLDFTTNIEAQKAFMWCCQLEQDRHRQLRPSLLREYIQKRTSTYNLSTKTLGTLPILIKTSIEVKNNDECLIDSTNDKKGGEHSIQVDDTTTMCYTKDVIEETQ